MTRMASGGIALYLNSMACGGAERVALLLMKAFLARDIQITLILAKCEGEFLPLVPKSVRVVDLGGRKPIFSVRSVARVIDELSPAAMICFGIYAGISAALSQSLFRPQIPLAIRIESNQTEEWKNAARHNRAIGPVLSRWAVRRAKIITVSNGLRNPTAEFLRVPVRRVTVIPNPVYGESGPDQSMTDLTIPHEWLIHNVAPTFVAIGRLEHQKGFDILIAAMKLATARVNCRLLIFGEGSCRLALQQQIKEMGLKNHVSLPGFTMHPELQLRHADGFILSSRWEGFGLVLVEAMAAGLPIVSTNCDFGPAELLENGRYGTLVPVNDPQGLADAIVQIAANGRKPAHIVPANWLNQFSAELAAERHLHVLGL